MSTANKVSLADLDVTASIDHQLSVHHEDDMTPHMLIRPTLQHCLQPLGTELTRVELGVPRYDEEELSLELVSVLPFEPVIPM